MIKHLLRFGERTLQWFGWIVLSVVILLLMPG